MNDGPFGLNRHISLFPFQEKGIHAIHAGRRVLCDQMGLGKTIQAIGALYLFQRDQNPDNHPHLIVVPTPALVDQWATEVMDKGSFIEECQILKIKTPAELDKIAKQIDANPALIKGKLFITIYDVIKTVNSKKREIQQARRLEKLADEAEETGDTDALERAQKRTRLEPDAVKGFFSRHQFGMMIMDEVHTMGSVLSYNFDGLRPCEDDSGGIDPRSRMALTGTPMAKTMHEIIATLAVTDPLYDYTEDKRTLISVAQSLGVVLSQLKTARYFSERSLTGEESLRALFDSVETTLKVSLAAVSTVTALVLDHYTLRNFETVRSDFLACKDSKLRRDYPKSYHDIQLPQSKEKQAAIIRANKIFDPAWRQTLGASTIFHVSGARAKLKKSEEGGSAESGVKTKTIGVQTSRDAIRPYKIAALKQSVLPTLWMPIVITADTLEEGIAIKNGIGRAFSIFDMHTLAAYRAACARFGSTTTIELPDDTLNRKAAQSAADIAFQLESGALDPAHFGDYDDMVPPNQVLVHVLVQPDRSRPDNLNQIEQAVLQYLGESDHIKALFTPGYLGLSAISKCLIYGKQEMVKGLIALVKQKGIQPSQLSSHVVAAIKFCREQPSSEYEELDIHKNLAANLSCLEKPPILIIPTQTTGLNLTEAKHLILFNQPKSLAVRDQVMARIDRIGQTEPISFYSFKPETDVDQWLHSICNLQKEALDILINPKAFYVMASQDDKASKTTELISTFFVAKAIFELIAQNMEEKDSESTDVDDLKTENIKRLKKMDFKSFLIQFRVFVRTKKLIETHRKEDPVPTGVSKPPEPKSSHAESNPGILDGLRLLADGAEDLDFFAAGGELFGDLDSAWEDTFNPDGTFNWDGLGAL